MTWGHLWEICEAHTRKTCFICHPEDAERFTSAALHGYISQLSEGDEHDRAEMEAMQAVLTRRVGVEACTITECPCGGAGKARVCDAASVTR